MPAAIGYRNRAIGPNGWCTRRSSRWPPRGWTSSGSP